ncbi:rRNA-binding ribosome biosynthesis protein rpf2 [Hanseniaspora osmophila]|uniref:Ribosome production factor 2 homolog n=1 Tax=Hanseniaspora osmophila TaxID=56408 RepID=A0A1E5RAA2_9ASCO|nr:Ribosome biogenesis protein RPF2 [Hanseniaspora osmophila]
MIRTVKPKNARSKRALEKKESKLVENVKQALFIPGNKTSKVLHDAMVDLSALKKPYCKRFTRKNQVLPFEDASTLEFFSEKNDSSIMVLGTHSKKRPNNLTFARTFGFKLYDMIELQIVNNYKLLEDFKKITFNVGLKPMFSFQGAIFDTHPVYKHVKSLFMDLYRGEVADLQDVAGLQHVISISVEREFDETVSNNLPNVLFRVYKLKTYKSDVGGKKLPRVELEEIGPRFDFKIGRIQLPSQDMVKEAYKKPKEPHGSGNKNIALPKNVELDPMGDKLGRIHVGKQDLNKLQTRKMKGLKSKYDQNIGDEDDMEAYMNEEEDLIDAEDAEPSTKKQKL